MTYPWESILSVLEGQRTLIKVDGKKQITGTFAVMERFKGHDNDIKKTYVLKKIVKMS